MKKMLIAVIASFFMFPPIPGAAAGKDRTRTVVSSSAARTEGRPGVGPRKSSRSMDSSTRRPGATRPWRGSPRTIPRTAQPATEKTDVWVAYDDKALYVAAFCHDSEPDKITGRLGRRDARLDSDWFMFAVDPYYDKRSGYLFGVNPSGSITDQALSNDVSETNPGTASGSARAQTNGEGWTVEMRIPFNQIRFPKKDEYVWGVNFRRVIKRKNESLELLLGAQERAGFRLEVRPARRASGASHPARHVEVPSLTPSARPSSARPRKGTPSRREKRQSGQRRLRSQGRAQEQPDPRRHGQSRFRPGRGGPGRPQPLGLRDVLPGETALLHRGRVALQRLRPRRGLSQRRHELAQTRPFSTAAGSAGRPRGMSPEPGYVDFPDRSTILGRGQGHRASSAAGTSASSMP